MSFTADDARAFLATHRTPARCTLCGAVDPPTRTALCGDPEDAVHLLVHDGCALHTEAKPAAVVLASRKLLDTDRAEAACEAVIALTEQLAATEAEARAALDALHARIDAASHLVGPSTWTSEASAELRERVERAQLEAQERAAHNARLTVLGQRPPRGGLVGNRAQRRAGLRRGR